MPSAIFATGTMSAIAPVPSIETFHILFGQMPRIRHFSTWSTAWLWYKSLGTILNVEYTLSSSQRYRPKLPKAIRVAHRQVSSTPRTSKQYHVGDKPLSDM